MVAEQPRSLQTSVRMASAASAGANPAVDTAMLQQWVQNVDANMVVIDGRLDALDHATVEMRGQVADINANLHVTIEQARGDPCEGGGKNAEHQRAKCLARHKHQIGRAAQHP